MPDLPELYEALDEELENLLEQQYKSAEVRTAQVVSALCAAIEVKQMQELHEYLNESALETACRFVIEVELATGHADTWGDLVEEVKSQLSEKTQTTVT